jgi:GMP synthase-like glutamine amidotransferase
MRAHYLQHVPFEGLGSIGSWLEAAGAEVTATRFYEDAALPPLADVDLLVAMGGPMSVNDESQLPWLVAEKRFVREAVERGVPVLGICLGAQLIASALGARVYPNRLKEIGWLPIEAPPVGREGLFQLPATLEVFHWHGETFDLPAGSSRLASSAGCKNQAFQLGERVVGLQFHLETTPESARAIVENCRDELVPSPYVQTEQQLLAADSSRYRAINAVMDSLLAFLTRGGGGRQDGRGAGADAG